MEAELSCDRNITMDEAWDKLKSYFKDIGCQVSSKTESVL